MYYEEGEGVPPLSDYPRPSVAVDTALLTVDDRLGLCVVLLNTTENWRLPGTFVHEREFLAAAVLRSLSEKAGVSGRAPRQLRVFDDPHRDDRGWVLSVAHIDVCPASRLVLDPARAQLVPTSDLPRLPFGHELIVESAVDSLRTAYRAMPDPERLIEEPFSLLELRRLHEAIAGAAIAKDAFRRTMQPQLLDTGVKAHGTVGKPARLFTRSLENR